MQQFQMLGNKQLVIQEGIDLLRQVQIDLSRIGATSDTLAVVAITTNALLIPLNCIINAFELKAANTLYQIMVRQFYNKLSASGTRSEGAVKVALAGLKQAVVAELKQKALTAYIPGVNILVGLAEDSLALAQTVQMVNTGSADVLSQTNRIRANVRAATQELVKLGIARAEILGRMQAIDRTA